MEDSVLCISESAGVKNFSLYTVVLNMKIHVVHCTQTHTRHIPKNREKPHVITYKNTRIHTLLHTTRTGEKQKEKKERRRRINVSTRQRFVQSKECFRKPIYFTLTDVHQWLEYILPMIHIWKQDNIYSDNNTVIFAYLFQVSILIWPKIVNKIVQKSCAGVCELSTRKF